MLESKKLTTIRDKTDQERVIIPTLLPSSNITALDVTDLSEEGQERLVSLYEEYAEYYQLAVKRLFTFEDWISHTKNEDTQIKLKWRTFVESDIKVN